MHGSDADNEVFLPEICENLLKASYDDRISTMYIVVKLLNDS